MERELAIGTRYMQLEVTDSQGSPLGSPLSMQGIFRTNKPRTFHPIHENSPYRGYIILESGKRRFVELLAR